MKYFAQKYDVEARIVRADKAAGIISPESIAEQVDEIAKQCRAKKKDLYILCDAVQHAPHGLIDVKALPVDGINFTPYKMFGNRGFGVGYLSPRMAELDHPGIIGNYAGDPWEIGGPAPASFAAVSAIVDYVCWIGAEFTKDSDRRAQFVEGMNRIKLQERALLNTTLKGTDKQTGLRKLKGVNVHFDNPDLTKRDFIMAITFDKLETLVMHFCQRLPDESDR